MVYADKFTKTESNGAGEEIVRSIPFLKGYTVFNVEQIDDLPAHYAAAPAPIVEINREQRISKLEEFFRKTGAEIRHSGDAAFYAEGFDVIQMPTFESFKDAESYYAVLAHEATHWTGHKSRLNREFKRTVRRGDEEYAKEELVAELGSAFLCADLQISPETREDHAAYIQSWLKALKDDKRWIFSAAANATRAADYLHGFSDPVSIPGPGISG